MCSFEGIKYRELAFQISEQFEALGVDIGVKCGGFFVLYALMNLVFKGNQWKVFRDVSMPSVMHCIGDGPVVRLKVG